MAEPPATESLGLPAEAAGVFPSQLLERAVELGWVHGGDFRIPPDNIQPASVDLRLGPVAYRMRCSFLPDSEPVEHKLKQYVIDELDLRDDGAVLETNRPYLIPLIEEVALPPEVRGRANPKSSTGRLDVFTRVITDRSFRFDEIAAGYHGRLWLEVVPAVVHGAGARAAGPQPAPPRHRRREPRRRRPPGHPRGDTAAVPRRRDRCRRTSWPPPTACSSAST